MSHYLEPRLTEDDARRVFRRRNSRHRLIVCLLRRKPLRPQLPRLELIWLPVHLISFAAAEQPDAEPVNIAVEGFNGTFAVFERHPWLKVGPPPGTHFAPKLSTEAAEKTGRQMLFQTMLRFHGNRHKFRPGAATAFSLFHHPYWVYYFERRRGLIDFLVLDAISGDRGGAKTKTSIVTALLEQG